MTESNGTRFEGSYRDEGDFDEGDIFAPAGPPPFNWTDHGVKDQWFWFQVESTPELIQGWDDEKKKPAVWEDSGNPKMNAVLQVVWLDTETHPDGDGQLYSLWATKPSALFKGLQTASRSAGASIRPRGLLGIKYGGRGKKERGQRSAPHLFPEATYIPES